MATPIMGKAREEYSACPRKTRGDDYAEDGEARNPGPNRNQPQQSGKERYGAERPA